MICIEKKEECCGCSACASVCPRKAIRMMPDEEGFLYPEVIADKCINCGLCEKFCPVKKIKLEENAVAGYIVRNHDKNIVAESTSGGAFTSFAFEIFRDGGVVYGAGYDANMRVICKKATCPEDLAEMRGSKFVQSDLGNTFLEIKRTLEADMPVLFSGTPCQVEGLLAFLREKPDKLFCVDFVCRGVPSPGLWENYVQMMQKKFNSKIIDARFKNKTYGYHATTMKIAFENGKTYYGSGRIDPMMKAFVEELASRPSCYSCAFKSANRNSDITMFDCYSFSEITNLHDDNKGYTSLLVHTKKGKEILARVESEMEIFPCDSELLIKENGVMVRNSAKMNKLRTVFYQLAGQYPIDIAVQKVSPITVGDHIAEKLKGLFFRTGLIITIKKVRSRIMKSVRRKT